MSKSGGSFPSGNHICFMVNVPNRAYTNAIFRDSSGGKIESRKICSRLNLHVPARNIPLLHFVRDSSRLSPLHFVVKLQSHPAALI